MSHPCQHWSDCGVRGGGCCAQGRYGGRPSLGICRRACEIGRALTWPAEDILPPAPAETESQRWERLWAELHLAEHPDAAWMAGYLSRMPCGQCKVDLVKKLAAHPPDYSSPWAWFVWTVWLHNDVLARQGRRQWSLAEAAARWGKAQPPSNAG